MAQITITSKKYTTSIVYARTDRVANNCGVTSLTSLSAYVEYTNKEEGWGKAVPFSEAEKFMSHNFPLIAHKLSMTGDNGLICLSDRMVTDCTETPRDRGMFKTSWFMGELLRGKEEDIGKVVASPLVNNAMYPKDSHAIMVILWVPARFKEEDLPQSVHDVYNKWLATPCVAVAEEEMADFTAVEPELATSPTKPATTQVTFAPARVPKVAMPDGNMTYVEYARAYGDLQKATLMEQARKNEAMRAKALPYGA